MILWLNIALADGDPNALHDPSKGISILGSAMGLHIKLPPELGGAEEIVTADRTTDCPCCRQPRRCLILSTVTVTICPRADGAEFYWRKIDE